MSEDDPDRQQIEEALRVAYPVPIIPLVDICNTYLNFSYAYARQQAALHRLPFPAFKLDDGSKAPWMVRVGDFADFLAARSRAGVTAWKKSQL